MNMPDKNSRYQPPPHHRRKTPSFSSSLLDSILRSIDETDDYTLHHLQQQQQQQQEALDHDLMFFASEPKRSDKIHAHSINEEAHTPSLRRVMMIDQWIETQNNNNYNSNTTNNNISGYVSSQSCRKYSLDSSGSGTPAFTTSSGSLETFTFPATPSTYRSLPNSFTISRKTAEAVFRDDTAQKASSSKSEGKFMKLTKLRAMKLYGDLKKAKQPISPGSRISAFIYSLFASSSSKKAKIEESMQNFRSLKKSRSIKQQDATMTCTSFSRSCMSKKQHTSSVKRSVRFYPENDDDTIIVDGKSVHDRDLSDLNHSAVLPKYERRWIAEKNYPKKYKKFMVNIEDDDDEDEDDLFELEIVGGVRTGSYGQELPVFETTDLRKIRI